MKAAVIEKPYNFTFKEVPTQTPVDNEVLVKNSYAGFCGTDEHIFHGDFLSTYPLIPGHEFSGIVEAVGDKISSFKPGDHVVIDPNICCNKCSFCAINEQNFCEDFKGYGVTENGGFAEYSLIFETNLHRIDEIPLDEAAMIEPLACAIYGINRIKIKYGDKVIIFGAGPIGILLLQLLKIKGAGKIVLVDINKKKLEKAAELSESEIFINDDLLEDNLKKVSPHGFDILVDATDISSVCQQIFKYINHNSSILFYGVCPQGASIKVEPFLIFRHNLSIHGAFPITGQCPRQLN